VPQQQLFNNTVIAHPVASYALPSQLQQQEQVISAPQFGGPYYSQSQIIQQPQVGQPILGEQQMLIDQAGMPVQVGNQLVQPQHSTGLPVHSVHSQPSEMLIDQLAAANVAIVTTASSVTSSGNQSYDFLKTLPMDAVVHETEPRP
jgi:hypothetical protein